LQDRELAVHKRLNGITAPLRETQLPEDTAEKLEAERQAAQDFIDNAEPLTEEEQAQKEAYLEDGFPDWSRRDFQQLVRALEAYGWTDDYDLLATDIQEKMPKEVKTYYLVFKKWKQLAEYPRIKQRIVEGEAKRNKRSYIESLLLKKIASVKYPMPSSITPQPKGRFTAKKKTHISSAG